MNTARFLIADVFDGLATLDTGSIDLVVTSPPFLALRSYLPADHPDKAKEVGSEATPAEYVDVLLAVTQELRRVLAPHGSICVELGDTYAGSGGAGGDFGDQGLRDGQFKFDGSGRRDRAVDVSAGILAPLTRPGPLERDSIAGWPLAKSKTLIPEVYRIALAYGVNPLTGTESPAGRWRIRNVVTWARPNPPVGALGDKWRPATSDIVVACLSGKRFWDDLATRRPLADSPGNRYVRKVSSRDSGRRPDGSKAVSTDNRITADYDPSQSADAPLLDYWELPPTGYAGAHYAVYPPELVRPLIRAMCPEKVCLVCGEPSRRIVERRRINGADNSTRIKNHAGSNPRSGFTADAPEIGWEYGYQTLGWTSCGHDNYRPGITLDPFAGTGTTGLVAVQEQRDALLIDLDSRNAVLAEGRIGESFFHTFELAGKLNPG